MKISIVVPTRKRPDMLRSALQSIRNQSRLDLVSELLVSENGEDVRSERVCNSMDGLPLRFCRQSPALSIAGHFKWLANEASSEWIAWLADDDMWGRYHIEEAARLLKEHPAAVAYAGESVTVLNDSRSAIYGFRETVHSMHGEMPHTFTPCWIWSQEDMLLNTLLQTPLNMWAMVFRKSALLEALESLVPSDAGYESDRLFLWRLASLGPVLVGREVSMFYRTHQNNTWADIWRKDPAEQQRMTRQYIDTILDEAEAKGMPTREMWHEVWQSLDDSARKRVLAKSSKASIEQIKARWTDAALELQEDQGRKADLASDWKSSLRPWIPPVVIGVVKGILRQAARKHTPAVT